MEQAYEERSDNLQTPSIPDIVERAKSMLDNSPIISVPEYNGKYVRSGEMQEILDRAVSIQAAREKGEAVRNAANSLERAVEGESGIPLIGVYNVAVNMGIPQECVRQAIEMQSPSRQTIVEDLKKHGAVPDVSILGNAITNLYRDEMIDALKSAYPRHFVGMNDDWLHNDRIVMREKTRKRTFLSRFRKKKFVFAEGKNKKIAEITPRYFGPDLPGVRITVFNPLFFRACGERLERLGKKFRHNIVYEYVDLRDIDDLSLK